MCGRFTLTADDPEAIAERFDAVLEGPPDGGASALQEATARYNIAPTQDILAVTAAPAGGSPIPDVPALRRTLARYRWGLVPSWAKDPSIGSRMINARAETLPEKNAYRGPLSHRRCLIPADGFYEWQTLDEKRKQPVYFRLADGALFAVAGLWEVWHSPDGSELATCTLITTTPNDLVAPVHDRMPAILRPEDEAHWLDPTASREDLLSLLAPYPAEAMQSFPVSRAVNNPSANDPTLIEPA